MCRDYITDEMHLLDPAGFDQRRPTSKKVHRVPIVVLGPDYEVSLDGHDKLSAIGFPIYGARDVWSGKWHGAWVLPNNRYKVAIAYVYLSLIKKLKGVSWWQLHLSAPCAEVHLGMPLQVTTDRGSETGGIYAFANALR